MTAPKKSRLSQVVFEADGSPVPDPSDSPAFLAAAMNGRFLQSLKHLVGGDLLDLGAGNRPFQPWYVGLTSQQASIDFEYAPGLSALALGENLPFADGSFDTVLATEVLEHTLSPESVVGEVHRVLRVGGSFFITAPFIYPVHEAPFDHWRFTHHGLRLLLERGGFDVAAIQSKGGVTCLVAHYLANGLAIGSPQISQLCRPITTPLQRGALRFRGSRSLKGTRSLFSLGYMAAGTKR